MQCDDWKIEKSKWKCMKLENQAVGSVRFVCVCAGWCKRKSHAMHVSNVFGECIQPEIRHQMTIEPKFQRAYLLLTTKREFSHLSRHSMENIHSNRFPHTQPAIDLWWWLCVVCNCKMCVPIVFFVVIPSNPSRLKRDFFPSIENETFQNRNASTFTQEKIARRLAKTGIKTLGLCWDTWMGVFQCGWQQFGHVFKPNECINVDFVQEATGEKTRSSD